MKDRERKKSRWQTAFVLTAVTIAVLACVLLIVLNMQKTAEEKKFERSFPEEKTLAKPPPTFPPLEKPIPDRN